MSMPPARAGGLQALLLREDWNSILDAYYDCMGDARGFKSLKNIIRQTKLYDSYRLIFHECASVSLDEANKVI